MTDSPILVGGCGSSGTSLLSQLLNAHPSIYCGPELFLLNKKALYNTPFEELKLTLQEVLKGQIQNELASNRNKPSSSFLKLYRRLQKLFHIRPTTSVAKIPIIGVLDINLIASSTYIRPRYGEALLSDPEEYGFTVEDWLELIHVSQTLRGLIDSFFSLFWINTKKLAGQRKRLQTVTVLANFSRSIPLANMFMSSEMGGM